MRKKLCTLLLALVAGMPTIVAADYNTGGFWYNLNHSAKTATITFKGDSYTSYTNEYSGSVRTYEVLQYNNEIYTITGIGDWAFADCTAITAVSIASYITKIGEGAFYNCRDLASVAIPGNVMIIGDKAFWACKSLSSITIAEGVKSIGERAFERCTGVSTVTIPSSVTSIGDAPFLECTKLTSIQVSENNDRYSSLDGVLFNLSRTTLIQYPAAKQGAYTIPDGVITVGMSAFADCAGLDSVTIPGSVAYIDNFVFDNCEALSVITNYAITPQVIDANVFGYANLAACTLYVPIGSVNAYKTADVWKNFGNIIGVEVPEDEKTAIDNVSEDGSRELMTKSRKSFRQGALFVEKNGKTYNASGAEVK